MQHKEICLLSFFLLFHPSCITSNVKTKFTIHPKKKGTYHKPCTTFTPSLLLFCCFTNDTLKKDQSRHRALHHFHTITTNFLRFYEPLPETRANYTITPIALGTSFIFALIFQRKEYFKTRFLWTYYLLPVFCSLIRSFQFNNYN